jgi:hypothetical protein
VLKRIGLKTDKNDWRPRPPVTEDSKNMSNIFISGPMTGHPNYNLAVFCDAHVKLKEAGANVIYNPALCWLHEPQHVSEAKDHASYMRECLQELSSEKPDGTPFYDIVVSLDGWENSTGAQLEATAAIAMGIPTMSIDKALAMLATQEMTT